MTQKPRKGDFGELKSQKFPEGACPKTSLDVRNRSVFRDSRPAHGRLPQSKKGKPLTSTFISNKYNGQLASYRKISKISPGAHIFQRRFLGGLFLEGLIFGGAYLWREICVSV